MIWFALVESSAGIGSQLLPALGLIATAIATYYASTFKARRDSKAIQDRQTDTVLSYSMRMTDQAQTIIARIQAEAVEALARANTESMRANAESARAQTLERELAEWKIKYNAAVAEIENLRQQVEAAARKPRR